MIKTLAIGAILFGLSAGASYYLLVPKVINEEADKTEKKADDNHAPNADPGHTDAVHSTGPDESKIQKVDQMPVSLRSDNQLSVETIIQLSESIRHKEQQMNDREKLLLKDEQRVKMMFDDLGREQSELVALGDRVDAKITAAKQLLDQIKQERAGLISEKQAFVVLQKKSGLDSDGKLSEDDEKLKKAKSWFQSLEADQGAKFIKEFANNGELEFATKLLRGLDPKQSAKILSALNDPALGVQLIGPPTSDK